MNSVDTSIARPVTALRRQPTRQGGLFKRALKFLFYCTAIKTFSYLNPVVRADDFTVCTAVKTDKGEGISCTSTPPLIHFITTEASVTKEQIGLFGKSVNQVDLVGKSAIYHAAERGLELEVSILCHHQADVNQLSNDGLSPLFVAAQNGHVGVVRELIRSKADVYQQANDGKFPLFAAAENGHYDCVKVLIELGNANVNQVGPKGKTAFFIAAENGHFSTFKLLDRYAVMRHPISTHGWTSLSKAFENGHVDIARDLAVDIVYPNLKSPKLKYPLFQAIEHNDLIAAERILAKGAKVDAANVGTKMTALERAVLFDNKNAIFLLEKHGARFDTVDGKGNSLVLVAVISKSVHCTNYIMQKVPKALYHKQNINGFAPMGLAITLQRVDIVELLLDRGVDPTKKALGNLNAYEHARNIGNTTIIALLKGSRVN